MSEKLEKIFSIFSMGRSNSTDGLIGTSPFNLVYGKEVVLPKNVVILTLALVQFIEETPSSSMQVRHPQILKLKEEREKAKITHAHHEQLVKFSFDANYVSS